MRQAEAVIAFPAETKQRESRYLAFTLHFSANPSNSNYNRILGNVNNSGSVISMQSCKVLKANWAAMMISFIIVHEREREREREREFDQGNSGLKNRWGRTLVLPFHYLKNSRSLMSGNFYSCREICFYVNLILLMNKGTPFGWQKTFHRTK